MTKTGSISRKRSMIGGNCSECLNVSQSPVSKGLEITIHSPCDAAKREEVAENILIFRNSLVPKFIAGIHC